jgi:hypothetical protein
MPESYTSVSINGMSEGQSLQAGVKVRHTIVLTLCLLVVIGSLLLQQSGDGLYLFGIKWPVSCALYQSFGVKCALCGLTRSFSSMARGDIPAAIQFHPLSQAVFAFVCLQISYRIYALWTARAENRKLRVAGIYLVIVLAGALLVNWFVYLGGLIL